MLTLESLNTFILTLLLIYFLKAKALTIGLVDRPDGRKRHRGEVPLIGGLAIFLACVLSLTTLMPDIKHGLAFLGGGAVVIVVGALDDYFNFPAPPRFLAQIFAALIMALVGGVIVTDLGYLLPIGGVLDLGVWALPFTVFATLGVINAVNMIDGADGLSGSVALVALIGLGVVAALDGHFNTFRFLALIISCLVAFLLFNVRLPGRSRASVFLGDAGSMFLGFALVWFIITLSQGAGRAMSPAAGLWFVMVPLFDTTFVMARRMLSSQSPFQADRRHLHHFLVRAGFTVNQTVLIIAGTAGAGVGVGLMGIVNHWPDYYLFSAFLGLFVVYGAAMSAGWRYYGDVARLVRRHSL